jgi:2-polyprenyl-3-methyl-5-hydroxy-6-metoxy-1,4-benzoquinol methylase
MKIGDSKSIFIHRRNKNVFFDGIDNSFIARVMNRLLRYYVKLSNRGDVIYGDHLIEYPLIFQHMDRDAKYILDFGCVEDLLPIHLSSLGYQVTGLDFRPYPFTHKNFNFIQTDIMTWEPEPEKYDTIISVSTIEHVGLSDYGDPRHDEGDKIAVKKLWSSLKKSGSLIVTVPAGKPRIERGMRIYNERKIREMIPGIQVIKLFYKERRKIISNLEYENYHTLAPAQGIAFVIAKKE